MFKKLRRNSKAVVFNATTSHRNSSVATTSSTTNSSKPTTITIFSLPGEIRNAIYELLASDIKLHLFNPNKPKFSLKPSTSTSDTTTSPGLLLASKQCRTEFLPILLSIAPITATITDFDFRPLQRVVGSLYSTELKAIRSNPSLTLRLRLKKCSQDIYPNLRRWCVERARGSLDRLGWRYELEEGAWSEFTMARFVWFAERVRVLYERVEGEGEKWEVRMILEVMRGEVEGGGGLRARRGSRGWDQGFGDNFVAFMARKSVVNSVA